MSDFTRHCLSFFKQKRVRYYYNGKDIHFTCPFCCSEAVMITLTATWNCENCKHQGTLITLSELNHLRDDTYVFNPSQERKYIIRKLKTAASRTKSAELNQLIIRIERLLRYWENQA